MDVATDCSTDQFVVDAIQGGAGTSTNMNANEVIANRGLQILGKEFGDYDAVHPINDVNASQSTNDVYPTALKIALIFEIQELINRSSTLKMPTEPRQESFQTLSKWVEPSFRTPFR
jgi:aspartate ammonia-lyase